MQFHNHTLLNPDAITWLGQFAGFALTDRQRLALVFLRQHGEIDNSSYRRLNRVDVMTAGHELRGLVEVGLVEQHGFGRWTSYRLKVPVEKPLQSVVQYDEERILEFVRQHGSINNTQCTELLGIKRPRARYLLQTMVNKGTLTPKGERRWTRYWLS